MCLQDLTHIHARRYAQGIQDNIHRGAFGKVGHVLYGQNSAYHPLITVPTGHLVPHRQLALNRQVNLDHFDHTWGQLVALLESGDFVCEDHLHQFDLFVVVLPDFSNLSGHLNLPLHLDIHPLAGGQLGKDVTSKSAALFDQGLLAVLEGFG